MIPLEEQLRSYKQLIDADIEAYTTHVKKTTPEVYGEYPALVTEAFLDMLARGGKRLRGALVMVGYEMCGGQDATMIVRAATALEMIHAHLLIIDDIQDRSVLRRGKPTVHEMLKTYHTSQHFPGEAKHTGISLALNAAWTGGWAAQMLIAGLTVEPDFRSKAAGIIAHAIVTTAHGQTLDIVHELQGQASLEAIEQTMEWKTAYYTLLNPLCVGMVLAGAGCEDTDAIRDYALHTGMAFQITDDIIGTYGSEAQTGKSIMDDMREGKQTLLTAYAFAHMNGSDLAFLKQCLGSGQLTEADFSHCRQLIKQCGALEYAQTQADTHITSALTALETHALPSWKVSQVDFLRQLALSLKQRTA
jgi:geranylgeranyl diphosphate synthase type I